jgi:hypothetical protein
MLIVVAFRVAASVPSATQLRHDRNEEWCLVGRQDEHPGTRRLAPHERCCGEMPCRRATSDTTAPGDIPLRHDPPLDLVAPPAATSRTDLDIHPAPRLRSVNYMVNHICEPYCM